MQNDAWRAGSELLCTMPSLFTVLNVPLVETVFMAVSLREQLSQGEAQLQGICVRWEVIIYTYWPIGAGPYGYLYKASQLACHQCCLSLFQPWYRTIVQTLDRPDLPVWCSILPICLSSSKVPIVSNTGDPDVIIPQKYTVYYCSYLSISCIQKSMKGFITDGGLLWLEVEQRGCLLFIPNHKIIKPSSQCKEIRTICFSNRGPNMQSISRTCWC
jgi:hypothetical protein